MIKHQNVIVIVVILACLISGFIGGVYVGRYRDIPFVARGPKYSIGIYIGEDPFNFVCPENINNPVLTAADVTDVSAVFVADPFMVKEDSTWYMFFEVLHGRPNQTDIGLATSNDGFNWTYKQIVLDEPFGLSYPYTFKWKGEYYMIPASPEAYSVRLYKAVDFPTQWSFVGTLINGDYNDPSIFHHDDKWWIFVGNDLKSNDILQLYYANDPMGPWTEHPESPIIKGDPNIARPGGRILTFDGRIVRYAQDDYPIYGSEVRAFEITELTTTSYKEREVSQSPILKGSGAGWNGGGMHQIDAHQIDENKWIACVDGYGNDVVLFGFEY